MSKKDKVKFNLRNVHWGLVTFAEDDTPALGPPNQWPGAVSLSLDPQGDVSPFYADGILYWRSAANNGYEGDFETALVPEKFRTEVLHEQKDANGVLVERADVETEHFYLMYEVEGDAKSRRNILYNCTTTRPGLNASTSETSKEPETDIVTLTATPLPKCNQVKAMTSSETNQTVYDNWFKGAYYNAEAEAVVDLLGLSLGSVPLVPTFDSTITVYTATTQNATNTITAEAPEGTAVAITVGGARVENGAATTWADGENTVSIVVRCGELAKSYTILVTKE